MNTYIQNKLDEFENKFTDTELGNFYSTVTTWKHTIGMPVHVKMFIEQALTEAYNKGQTDYHNHIVEKIESKIGDLRIEKMIDFDSEKYYGSQIENFQTLIDQLQDTNPKE